ncbi:hypothetical protein AAE478_006522 [Parahypoxylon ruwenzoriense]
MLQSISSAHDQHHERRRKNSLASLSASLHDGKTHLLLAASGSVATIKLPLIISALASHHQQNGSSSGPAKDLSIRVLLTPAAARFLAGQSAEQPPVSSLLSMPCVDGVYVDADEWREPWKRGDAILHIELRRWAHLLVIAPLSANTMAKIVAGFADGILTSVVRAWDPWGDLDPPIITSTSTTEARGQQQQQQQQQKKKKKRILVACAMNTAMWRHPVTAKNLRVLEEEWGVGVGNGSGKKRAAEQNGSENGEGPQDRRRGGNRVENEQQQQQQQEDEEEGDGWFEVLRPQQKALACGDVGDGAMMDWRDIVDVIEDRLRLYG